MGLFYLKESMDQILNRFERRLCRSLECWPDFDTELSTLYSQVRNDPIDRESYLAMELLAKRIQKITLLEQEACNDPFFTIISRSNTFKAQIIHTFAEDPYPLQNRKLLQHIENIQLVAYAHFYYMQISTSTELEIINGGYIDFFSEAIPALEEIKRVFSTSVVMKNHIETRIPLYIERYNTLWINFKNHIVYLFESGQQNQIEDLYHAYDIPEKRTEAFLIAEVASDYGYEFGVFGELKQNEEEIFFDDDSMGALSTERGDSPATSEITELTPPTQLEYFHD